MGFSIVYKKLIFKGIKFALRIRCIMLILEILKFDATTRYVYLALN